MEIMNKAVGFVKDAYYELKQVTWLSRKELIAQTSVVVILILLVALYVGLVDFLLSKALGLVLF